MDNKHNLLNQRFGRWTVIGDAVIYKTSRTGPKENGCADATVGLCDMFWREVCYMAAQGVVAVQP